MGKIVKIGIGLLIIGVIGVVVLLSSGVSFGSGTEKITLQKTVDAKSISQLVVKGELSDIRIHPSSLDQVQIKLTGSAPKSTKTDLQANVTNQTLEIAETQERKSFISFGFDFDLLDIGAGMDMDIYIPEKTYEAITMQSQFGDIKVDQKLLAKKVNLKSEKGDVTLNGYQGDLLVADVQFGNVKLNEVDAAFDINTELGDVEVQPLTEFKNKNSIKTQFGSVRIQLAKEPSALNLDFSTEFGDIKTDFPVSHTTSTTGANFDPISKSLKGSIGNATADSPSLTIQTDKGDISLGK